MAFRSAHRPPGIVVVAASDTPDAKRRGAQYRCDGVADQVEVQAAIASIPDGGKVLLLEGTYNLTATVNLIADLVLEGEGPSTRLVQSANAAAIAASAVNGVVVRGLAVTGPGTTQANGHGVSFDTVDHGTVEDVQLDSCRESVRLVASTFCRVTRCRVLLAYIGVNGDATSTDARVAECAIGVGSGSAPTRRGVELLGARAQVVGNRLNYAGETDVGGRGIAVDGTESLILGNLLTNSPGSAAVIGKAIFVGSGSRTVVSGNTIVSAGGGTAALEVSASNCAVVGNLIDLAATDGIRVSGDGHLIATNNVLRSGQKTHNTYRGIRAVTATKVSFQGNSVKHLGAANKAAYGLELNIDSDDAFVANNDLRESGFTGSLLNDSGTGTFSANQI